jgi:hypothetical protein
MIVKFTDQETKQRQAIFDETSAKIYEISMRNLEYEKGSEEYENGLEKILNISYERRKALEAIYEQAEKRAFEKVSGSTESLVKSAKYVIEATIADLHQLVSETLEALKKANPGLTINEELYYLNAAHTIDVIRESLHLHLDALKDNPAPLK